MDPGMTASDSVCVCMCVNERHRCISGWRAEQSIREKIHTHIQVDRQT